MKNVHVTPYELKKITSKNRHLKNILDGLYQCGFNLHTLIYQDSTNPRLLYKLTDNAESRLMYINRNFKPFDKFNPHYIGNIDFTNRGLINVEDALGIFEKDYELINTNNQGVTSDKMVSDNITKIRELLSTK